MAKVWIPSLLRDLTNGQAVVSAHGANVGQIIDSLELLFPGVGARLRDGNKLRAGLAVVVDSQMARRGLQEPVGENSEVQFLPAIGGGDR